jgi:hypothetical protein
MKLAIVTAYTVPVSKQDILLSPKASLGAENIPDVIALGHPHILHFHLKVANISLARRACTL